MSNDGILYDDDPVFERLNGLLAEADELAASQQGEQWVPAQRFLRKLQDAFLDAAEAQDWSERTVEIGQRFRWTNDGQRYVYIVTGIHWKSRTVSYEPLVLNPVDAREQKLTIKGNLLGMPPLVWQDLMSYEAITLIHEVPEGSVG